MNWKWTSVMPLVGVVLAATSAPSNAAPAAPEKGKVQIPLFIFEQQIRAAAPGIEKVITISDDQKKKLETIYNEVLGGETIVSASKQLRDESLSPAQRQEALQTLQSAREWFVRRCHAEVFTPAQNETIRKVTTAYNEVRTEVLRDLGAKITSGMDEKLKTILTADQKAAMEKAKAEMKAAAEKPAAAQAAPAKTK